MRRRPVQPLRDGRSQWLLLPELPLRGAQRERTRGEEQVCSACVLVACGKADGGTQMRAELLLVSKLQEHIVGRAF